MNYAQDTTVTRFLIWSAHRSLCDTQAYIARCIAEAPETSRTYVLTGRDSGDVRGAFALRRVAAHRLDFGYVLARSWWGQGLMTEVLVEAVNWVMRQPSIFRIGAVCDVENVGSARVMEKAGLFREGILRRWLVFPDSSEEPRDCFILRTDSIVPTFIVDPTGRTQQCLSSNR
jgi:RimJ/RimL family protein N-acetyltransferase